MPSAVAMTASVSLQKGEASPVGPDRIALLEAIGDHRSITAGGKAVGLSYRAAWDAVRALNGLSNTPLVKAQAGGQKGGFAEVTAEGRAVISAFHAAEAEVAQVLAGLEGRLGNGETSVVRRRLGLKTSARNVLPGVVESLSDQAVEAEVVLDVGGGARIVSQITRKSADALGLAPGRPAMALIKSSLVRLAKGDIPSVEGTQNPLPATVMHIERGVANDEVTLAVGGEITLTATIAHDAAAALALAPGAKVTALIDASNVILATSSWPWTV